MDRGAQWATVMESKSQTRLSDQTTTRLLLGPEGEGEGEVAQSCPTLCDPMECSLPGFSVHGILQARILE